MSSATLAALLVQSAVVLTVGLSLPTLLRLRQPLLRLRYWQMLLAVSLVLPFLPTIAPVRSEGAARFAGNLVIEVVAEAVPSNQAGQMPAWLAVGLAIVGLGFVIRLGIGIVALTRLRRNAERLKPLPEAIRAATRRVGRSVPFLVSQKTAVPVTFGWLRPVVLLPESFLDLSPNSQEALACHELLHVRRRHWPVALAEELIRAALWFHPGVWILLGRIALAREQVVDADVVSATGRRRSYLEGLWHMAREASGASPAPAIALLNRSHLKDRVTALIQEVAMSRSRTVIIVFAAGVAIGAAVTAAIAAFPANDTPPLHVPPLQAVATVSDSGDKQPKEPQRYQPDKGISQPEIIHKVNPQYPEEARKEGLEGVVVADTVVTEEGHITDIKILKSTDPIFEQATIDALEQWRFKPAMLEGEPVAVFYVLTTQYRLNDKKDCEEAE